MNQAFVREVGKRAENSTEHLRKKKEERGKKDPGAKPMCGEKTDSKKTRQSTEVGLSP